MGIRGIRGICRAFTGVLLTAHLAFAGQSGGSVWATDPPDHVTLFKLYMAANADVLDKDDGAAWEHHVLFKMPPSTQGPINAQCTALNSQLMNEITAQKLLSEARAEFKSALAQTNGWPRTARFRLAARAALHPYDATAGSFPVVPTSPLLAVSANSPVKVPRDASSPNDTGFRAPAQTWCPAGMRIASVGPPLNFSLVIAGNETLRSLPMSASAAEAYLNAHPNRDVQFEAIVEVGPVAISPNRTQWTVPVAARLIQARAVDPVSGQTIHQYGPTGAEPPAPSPNASSAPASAAAPASNTSPAPAAAAGKPGRRPQTTGSSASTALPMNSYRGFLLTVRDNPQVASPAALLPPTRMQVLAEQRAWTTIQGAIDGSNPSAQAHYKLNPRRKAFIYEWQTETARSRTDLVDVFLRTDADWSFVTREPEWDARFGAVVDAFLFSRKSVEGRDASFAAQELVPVYKQHLDAAVAKAPTKLFITLPVPAAGYDFASKSIRFLQAGTNVQQGRPYEGGTELLQSTDDPRYEGLTLPPSASATANYHLFGAVQSMHRADPPSSMPGVNLNIVSPAQSWRSYFSIGSSGSGEGENIPYVEVLALDRQLRLASIPLDPARAEKIAKASNYATMGTISGLTAKVFFDADRVELSQRNIGGLKARYALLFARLQRIDIHGPDNELLTSFTSDVLPAPAARPAKTQPAAQTLAPEQRETLGERQKKIDQDVGAKTKDILADLKKKSDAQLAQAGAASQAAASPAGNQPQGAVPAGPGWQPCRNDLRSGASQTPVPVAFVNTSRHSRKLYWLDTSGAKIPAGTVQPGLRAAFQTFSTHVWMVADASDQCLGMRVISQAGLIEIH
jgi:hypothetical protein